jgi:alkylhydroperoxidase/carboxymuconolactone decarboxylase family protein YurZ
MYKGIYKTKRRISTEGLSEDFAKEAEKHVQEPLFGEVSLYGGSLGTHAQHTSIWAFGVLFGRGGLNLKTRALLILAGLIVLPREDLVRIWINCCLNAGCTEEEIRELIIWTSHFGGSPVARIAGTISVDVFNKRRTNPDLKMTPSYLPWIH